MSNSEKDFSSANEFEHDLYSNSREEKEIRKREVLV